MRLPRWTRSYSLEIALAALALAGVIALQLYAVGGPTRVLSQPPWYDEMVTRTLALDPDFGRSLAGVRSGFEVNPPTLALLHRLNAAIFGDSLVAARSLSLASVYLAMVGAYLAVRRVAPPVAALAGALAIWSTNLGLSHALELRFYGPLLAATAWAIVFSPSVWDATPSLKRLAGRVAFAVAAALTVSMHYFGVVGLGLLMLPQLLGGWRRLVQPGGPREAVGVWLPLIVPALALAACLPFLHGQLSHRGSTTWIKAMEAQDVPAFLYGALRFAPLVIVFIAYAVDRRIGLAATPAVHDDDDPRPAAPELRGMGLLVLMPVFLAVYSFVQQPVSEVRYSIVTLLALALFVAVALRGVGRVGLATAVALLLVNSVFGLRGELRERESMDRKDNWLARLVNNEEGLPVYFAKHKTAATASWGLGTSPLPFLEASTRVRVLDDETMAESLAYPAVASDRFTQAAFDEVYGDLPGGPHTAPPPAADESFIVVTDGWLLPEVAFPEHQVVRMEGVRVWLEPK